MSTTNTIPAKQRRTALETLSRDRLAALTEHYELSVSDRRVVKHHVDALVQARRLDFADLLAQLERDELKDMCQALGLDDTGREKQLLIDRILALGGSAPASVTAAEPAAAAPARNERTPRAKAEQPEASASLGFENKL